MLIMDMVAWRRRRRVLARVTRAAWRLEQAERERVWALASAKAEGVSIRQIAQAAGLSPSRVHQVVADADVDALDDALGALRRAGWPAPEDPDTADGDLSGRADVADRLEDEVQWIRQCADWLEHLDREPYPSVVNLRPESDWPRRYNVVADAARVLAGHAADLDAAWRAVGGGIVPDGLVSIDAEGRLHVAKDDARDTPPSLVDLRDQTGDASRGRSARGDPGGYEHPAFVEAFTAVSGGNTRLADLHVSIAALLTAHALNVGLKPVLADLPALTRDRLAHVDQHYLRPENYAAANAVLIEAQATIPLAQVWAGRRGRRDAVRGPGAHRGRPGEPQVLRPQAGRDLAEHDL